MPLRQNHWPDISVPCLRAFHMLFLILSREPFALKYDLIPLEKKEYQVNLSTREVMYCTIW